MHDTEAERITENGWRQGSVLPSSIADEIVRDGHVSSLGGNDILVVISHDCDVTNASYQNEPNVELLKGRIVPLSEKAGNLAWGKSPRQYQTGCQWKGKEHICQLSIHDKIVVPRNCLAADKPARIPVFREEDIRAIALWIARRYSRTALPDAFVDRTRRATEKLRKKLKRKGDLLTAIFILVEDEELPDDKAYTTVLVGAMREEDHEIPERRKEAQRVLDDIEAALGGCDGIEVAESVLESEADISLADRRNLKRWDFDDLTVRGKPVSDLPPID